MISMHASRVRGSAIRNWITAAAALGAMLSAVPRTYAASTVRVLAGIREYPEPVIDALVTLSNEPSWIKRAADRLRAQQTIPWQEASMPEPVQRALQQLAPTPTAILVADENPEELARLRELRGASRESNMRRIDDLRMSFDEARRTAALAWERELQPDPTAQIEYRDLLTRFCRSERERNPNFACVVAMDERYYFACPPDWVVMQFARQEGRSTSSLARRMEDWWRNFGEQRTDTAVLERQVLAAAGGPGGGAYTLPPDERLRMWRLDEGASGVSLGLIPVLLQPPADQPDEARLAEAELEHARLWSRPEGGIREEVAVQTTPSTVREEITVQAPAPQYTPPASSTPPPIPAQEYVVTPAPRQHASPSPAPPPAPKHEVFTVRPAIQHEALTTPMPPPQPQYVPADREYRTASEVRVYRPVRRRVYYRSYPVYHGRAVVVEYDDDDDDDDDDYKHRRIEYEYDDDDDDYKHYDDDDDDYYKERYDDDDDD